MKKYLFYILFTGVIIFIAGFHIISYGQDSDIGRIQKFLDQEKMEDTARINLLLQMGDHYYFNKPDSALAYANKALNLSKEIDHKPGMVTALHMAGEMLRVVGDYPGSLKMQYEALDLNKKMKDTAAEAASLGFIGVTYIDFTEYRQGLQNLHLTNALYQKLPLSPRSIFALSNTGDAYGFLNLPDSALYYQMLAYEKLMNLGYEYLPLKGHILIRLGVVYESLGNKDSALHFYYNTLLNSGNEVEKINTARVEQKIATIYQSLHQYDSAMFYGRRAFRDAQQTAQKPEIMESALLLANLHRNANTLDSALFYQEVATAMKDSLYGPEKFKQLQLLMLQEQQRQQQVIQEQQEYKYRIKYVVLFVVLGITLLLGFILFRNYRLQKTAKSKVEMAFSELKDTQAQLIQREKMASLGELTAGIAHEIQNPLNFVNNFSEVNGELIKELREELAIGNEQLAKGEIKATIGKLKNAIEVSNDIGINEEKINHHGKRAEYIVKSMLQHSRTSTGTKELTDINALADEYLRLSYYGLRAKDKSQSAGQAGFNAEFRMDFDPTLPLINVIPQDIGRVLLNLFNNAFWAVNERRNGGRENGEKPAWPVGRENATSASGLPFSPCVILTTKNLGDHIEIRITDNGPGIPFNIIDKIFQPFFTTKPTGQGTGLGLSLAYDIVKAHGGEIKVNTKEARPDDPVGRGEGSEFIIQLRTN